MNKNKKYRKYVSLSFMVLFFTIVMVFSSHHVQASNKIGYVNYSYLNLREKNNTSSKIIVKLDQNDQLEILKTLNNWYKVIATNKGRQYTGYVYAKYVTFKKPVISEPEYIGYVRNTILNLRKEKSLTSEIVIKLSKNDKLAIDGYSDGWYAVTALHKEKLYKGYLAEAYVAFYEPKDNETIGYVDHDTLNLRAGASSGDELVIKLSKYDPLLIRESLSNGWYKVTATHEGVRYNGFVSGEYIQNKALDLAFVKPSGFANLTKLNLRKKAGKNEKVIAVLSKNDALYIVSQSNGWDKVVAVHNDKYYYGYVMDKYIRKNILQEEQEQVAYVQAAKLKLRKEPSYSGVIIMILTKNDKAVIHDHTLDGWYQVTATHNGTEYNGFLRGEYLRTTSGVILSEVSAHVNSKNVKLYDKASLSANVILALTENDKLVVTGVTGDWCKVIASHENEKYEGYIQSIYATKD